MADRDQYRGVTRVLGALHGHGEQVVLFQHLDRPYGPTCRRGESEATLFVAATPGRAERTI